MRGACSESVSAALDTSQSYPAESRGEACDLVPIRSSHDVNERRDGSRSVGLLTRHHVRVRVEREGHRGMSKAFTHDLDVDACGEELGGVSVPQVVEADSRRTPVEFLPCCLSDGADQSIECL